MYTGCEVEGMKGENGAREELKIEVRANLGGLCRPA